MSLPSFPSDFRVLHTEGASYWWWSPHTGPDWDGTMPVGMLFPEGLMIGNIAHDSTELITGEEFIVQWTDAECSPTEARTAVYEGEQAQVNDLVRIVLARAGVLSPS